MKIALLIPLLLGICLVLKLVAWWTVEKLMAVVEKAIVPKSFLLLPVGISSGPSRFSALPVHCPPARTMDWTRSFMAGMQMKANESAWYCEPSVASFHSLTAIQALESALRVTTATKFTKPFQLWHAFTGQWWKQVDMYSKCCICTLLIKPLVYPHHATAAVMSSIACQQVMLLKND